MISARLIKALEDRGFYLELPKYNKIDDTIIEILKNNNSRLSLSLPLFLNEEFNYSKITAALNHSQEEEFAKAIAISEKIYKLENIKNNLKNIIKQSRTKAKFSNQEFEESYQSFRESILMTGKEEQDKIERQSKLRLNLDLNKGLAVLFSPAKLRIMGKIFNHETITNTELKYYYRSISNINKSVLNPGLQNYLRVIETTRKEKQKVL